MALSGKHNGLRALWLYVVLAAPAQSCVIIAPKEVRPGVEETIVISTWGITSRGVTLILHDYPKKEHTIFQRTFGVSGAIDVVRIFIDPDNLDADELRLGQRLYVSLTAVCGQAFTKEAILPVKRRSGYLLLQSDKPIYTPRQTVNLRMIAVGEDLVPTAGQIKLEIKNPEGVVAHETMLGAVGNTSVPGMFSHSYSFPATPVLGMWSAVVSYGFRLSQETNITFELKEYVPPSFSAKITTPSVILPDSDVTIIVEAKYPYGKPVQGSVTCKFKTRNTNTGAVQSYPGAEFVTKELVHGNATFSLPNRARWGRNLHVMHLGSRLVVEAEVLDRATGERVTAEDDSAVYAQSPYRVSFRRTDPNFRPGGSKVVMADVMYANGQPAALVPCTVKAETGEGFNVPVDPDVAVTDARGRVAFTVLTERQHRLISAKVETLLPSEPGLQAVGEIFMSAFRSQNYAVLFLESADGGKVVKVGGVISIRVGVYPPTTSPAYYIVTHNGQVKQFGELHQDSQPGSSYRFARFSVTADMSPSVRVLAYAFHEGQLLADTLVIEVEEACLEKAAITVETDFESDRPGTNGSVKILGSSGTRVGVLGINKQVSELAREGLLTSNKMFAELKSHDMGCGPGGGSTISDVLSNFGVVVISQQSPDVIHEDTGCQPLSRGRSSLRRLKRSVQSEHASVQFLDECCSLGRRRDRAGRSCDVRADIVRRYISGQKGEQCAGAYMGCCSRNIGLARPVLHARLPERIPDGSGVYFSSVPVSIPDDTDIEGRILPKPALGPAPSPLPNFDEGDEYDEAHDMFPDTAIRNDFRETWLFDERVIGPDGVADIATTLPHSITTWSVQAVSVAPSGGVCIPRPREVRAFQPFFLQVALPYNVVRKEQIELLATVYNYVNETIRCNVYVYGVEGVCTGTQEGERSERRTVSVNASSASSLSFPVVPLREGRFTIKVYAHCNQSSSHSASTHDVVEKELHVVPEGVPVEKVVAVQIDPAGARKRTAQRSATDVYDDSVDPVTNHQTISINLLPPSDAVPGTRSSSLSLTGNQLGPSAEETLDEIEALMRRPTGSSEEIDTLMAQTLHALEYLRRKNVTDPALEKRGRRYLRDGYQRQLSFWNETGFFSDFENMTPESIRLTALVTRTLCKARQHISIKDSVISSTIKWLQRQEESIVFRGFHETRREVEIRDAFVANRAFIVVTFVECMPFIEEKRLAVEMEEVLYRLHLDTRFLMVTNQQRRNGYAFALTAYAVARAHVGEYQFARTLLGVVLVDDPLQDTRSTGIDKSSKTVEGTSYALLALLTADTNDTDTIQSLVNWLNMYRPSPGTSSLRHDTAVSLQALMEFDLKKFSKLDVDLMCNVTMSGQREFYKSIQITPENAAVRQQVDIRDMSGTLLVTANGTGSGLLSVRMKYNVLVPPELLCKFNITVHADVHKPKARSTEPDGFPQELLDDLLGIDRERRSADFASSPNEHHRATRSSNQPQQSKLVYDVEVCSQYIGESDSNAAVIEVGLLSGFDPVAEDLDVAIKSNTNLSKYLVTEKKVILYFNRIPSQAATCVQFRTERKHVVHNIQSAAVKVYDYSDPSHSCTQFYGLESTSPLLKVACTGTKCQCIEAECPRRMPFLKVTRVIPEQIKRQILLEMACKEHDFVWIGSVTGNSVLNGFRHIHLRVKTVLKEGSENRQSVLKGEKLFLAPHHCGTADLGVGAEYFVLGRDGEPFANNGSVGVRYSLDKHVRLFNVHSMPRWGSRRRLNSVFYWLSSELQKHEGCPEHLRVVRSATFCNEQLALPKRL